MNIKKVLLSDNSCKIYFLFAILTGIFVRFYGLEIQSYWFDELCTVTKASFSNILNILGFCIALDVHPPLYYIFMHYWIKLFGDSEIIVRLPSAVIGSLSVFLTYFMTRHYYDKYIAISTTILLALSGSAIYYSQEAKSYSILLFFSIILTLFWLNMLKRLKESDIETLQFIFYGFIALIASYLHYFGAVLVFFQLIYLFLSSLIIKKSRYKILILGSAIAVMFLPWITLHLIVQKGLLGGNYWIKNQGAVFYTDLVDFFFGKYTILLLFPPFLFGLRPFINNVLSDVKAQGIYSPIISLSYLISFPIIILSLISLHTPILMPKYFIVLLPAIFLLTSILLNHSSLSDTKANIYIFIVALVGVVLYLFPITQGNKYKFYYQPTKQSWREASKYVVENFNDNSIILVNKNPILYRYYFDKYSNKKLPISSLLDPRINYWIIKEKYNQVFFVLEYEFKGGLELQLKQDCKKYEPKSFIGNVHVYKCTFR